MDCSHYYEKQPENGAILLEVFSGACVILSFQTYSKDRRAILTKLCRVCVHVCETHAHTHTELPFSTPGHRQQSVNLLGGESGGKG